MKKLSIIVLLSFSAPYLTKCSSAATCEDNYRNGLYSHTNITKTFPTNKESFEQAINDVVTEIKLNNTIAAKLRRSYTTLFVTPNHIVRNDIRYQTTYWNILEQREVLNEEHTSLIRSMNQHCGKNKRKFEE